MSEWSSVVVLSGQCIEFSVCMPVNQMQMNPCIAVTDWAIRPPMAPQCFVPNGQIGCSLSSLLENFEFTIHLGTESLNGTHRLILNFWCCFGNICAVLWPPPRPITAT